jgi:hypothetical protein
MLEDLFENGWLAQRAALQFAIQSQKVHECVIANQWIPCQRFLTRSEEEGGFRKT